MAGRSGLGEPVAAQGLTGRPDGIERVGFGAVAAGSPLGPVQLHHLLGVGVQEAGQTSTVAASAFDCPDPLTWLVGCHLEQLLVPGRGGRHRHLGDDRASGRSHDRGSVGVFVGVDPDDELDEACQHVHRVDSLPGDDVDGSVRTGRTARL